MTQTYGRDGNQIVAINKGRPIVIATAKDREWASIIADALNIDAARRAAKVTTTS
jgi:hypothetical protein